MTQEDPNPTVQALVEGAQALATRLPAGLRRLRLEAGDHRVEVEWADGPVGPTSAVVAPPADGQAAVVEAEAGHPVLAPLVGTFYRAPEPGADPFVSEGDAVEEGQDIGIVEAMKIMNRVAADAGGTVRRILVADGEMVEFGQPLLILDLP